MTGNDFALAQTSVQLAINWNKQQPQCDFCDQQIGRLTDLNIKLGQLLDRHSAEIERTDGECEFDVSDASHMTLTT